MTHRASAGSMVSGLCQVCGSRPENVIVSPASVPDHHRRPGGHARPVWRPPRSARRSSSSAATPAGRLVDRLQRRVHRQLHRHGSRAASIRINAHLMPASSRYPATPRDDQANLPGDQRRGRRTAGSGTHRPAGRPVAGRSRRRSTIWTKRTAPPGRRPRRDRPAAHRPGRDRHLAERDRQVLRLPLAPTLAWTATSSSWPSPTPRTRPSPTSRADGRCVRRSRRGSRPVPWPGPIWSPSPGPAGSATMISTLAKEQQ